MTNAPWDTLSTEQKLDRLHGLCKGVDQRLAVLAEVVSDLGRQVKQVAKEARENTSSPTREGRA
jgi:hypothetical protein